MSDTTMTTETPATVATVPVAPATPAKGKPGRKPKLNPDGTPAARTPRVPPHDPIVFPCKSNADAPEQKSLAAEKATELKESWFAISRGGKAPPCYVVARDVKQAHLDLCKVKGDAVTEMSPNARTGGRNPIKSAKARIDKMTPEQRAELIKLLTGA